MSLPPDAVELCRTQFDLEDFPDTGPVVPRAQLVALATALRDELDYRFFVYCAATHYPEEPAVEANPDKDIEARDALPDRTLVAYRVRRLPSGDRATDTFPFVVWVPTGETTPSLTDVWAGADWQEREQFDLVGTVFADHPDLRRIMMPEDWPGHPLRRDYAIETQHFPWR